MEEYIKIDLTGLRLPKDLLLLIRRIYQHEQTPEILKTYVRFELTKYLGTQYNIKGFLEGDDD